MRILILTILFFSGFYYFSQDEKSPEVAAKAVGDSIKVKSAAPDRVERILTVSKKVEVKPEPVEEATPTAEDVGREISAVEEEPEYDEHMDQVEEIPVTELDQAWNGELKDVLSRLEPMDGDQIHKAYLSEIESYRAEMDALMNEKQTKATQEEALEVDQMMSQLDLRHEDNLREIFGAHYDAVRDHYQEYMQSNVE